MDKSSTHLDNAFTVNSYKGQLDWVGVTRVELDR